MSYEPTLIIVKADLMSNEDYLEGEFMKAAPKKLTDKWRENHDAIAAVRHCLYRKSVSVSGTHIILYRPEGTAFSRRIRDILYNLNIEFAEYD